MNSESPLSDPTLLVPLAKPVLGETEITNVLEALQSGVLASGAWVMRFEEKFASYVGVNHAVTTTSGTVALDLALKALNIKEGDEVLVPDFSFIATANAVLFQNAKPVFVDVNERTFTIDPDDAAEKITAKTKAVLGVHLFGHPFDVKALQALCADHQLYLIEDCAQAHGAEYERARVGTFGDLSCFSFNGTNNMTTGEGGMVTTNDSQLAEQVRLLINHGQSQKYLHTSLGYNYRMTELQAALGLAQLQQLERFTKRRITNAKYLNHRLNRALEKPYKEKNVRHVYHQYVLKLADSFPMSRDAFMSHLSQNGIGTAVHYPLPIHMQPLYQNLGYERDQCPTATRLAKQVLSLPVHPALSRDELVYIHTTINAVR
ncbi:MAG TPA: DegT/DnrJ/EryC1/StrS family aminotransferase [Methanomicrobia archaeon]|nr:DegT/DnrJ/EryC1/StrS family aminotransferase [Methanomicrobia archaeon]